MSPQPDLNATSEPIAVNAASDPIVTPAQPPPDPTLQTIDLTIVRVCVPVKLTDVNGNIVNWTLNEMTGIMRDEWQQSMQSRTKIEAGKIVGGDVRGIQTSLLVRCLVKEDLKPPTEALLSSFPCSSIDVLFDRAIKINRLDKDAAQKKTE